MAATQPISIEPEDLIAAGFVKTDDPVIPWRYDLTEVDDEDEAAFLGFGYPMNEWTFFICDPWGNEIYISAESAQEAVDWSHKIYFFSPNF